MPRTQQAGEVMERQVHHLNRLVDDLLEVSRITRGIIEVRKEPLDLSAIVKAAVETSRPVLDNLRHELVVDLDRRPDCRRRRPGAPDAGLRQPAQQRREVHQSRRPHLDQHAPASTARRSISVKDNGIGIAPNALAQVFDMFMQVDRSTRRSQGGLGIGLTLVRSLVGMHGGSVEARSEGPGLGSEFIVRLPLLDRRGGDRGARRAA